MLWNKRKPTDPDRVAAGGPDHSGYRVAEPDRALSAVATLLQSFGRFAFDTESSASLLREQCEHWARRITLGEARASSEARASGSHRAASDPPAAKRDWRGLERFFVEQRKREAEYVAGALGGLRQAVLSLGRALGTSIGEDREADSAVEERLAALEGAVARGDIGSITRAASAAIEVTRNALKERRQREARHSAKLDKELRELRDALDGDPQRGAVDELTGLYSRGAYEQQLEQLSALGGLLERPPWLVLVEVSAARTDATRRALERPRQVPDGTLRAASHSLSRTFLRRHDFAARSGINELSVFVTDMTQAEVSAAVERLLVDLYNAGRSAPRGEAPSVSIGVARLRASDDGARWRARADLALERAREDGVDRHALIV